MVDWAAFLHTNSSAVIGLVGVIIGAVLSAIRTVILQAKQRRWARDDQRREWERQRPSERLDPAIEWVESTLRLLRLFDATTDEEIAATDFWETLQTQLPQEFKDHELKDATVGAQVMVLGDDTLTGYYDTFQNLRNHFVAVLASKQLDEISGVREDLTIKWVLMSRPRTLKNKYELADIKHRSLSKMDLGRGPII